MSFECGYPTAADGRRRSRGLNLDEIKFIDDEDDSTPTRTVRQNVGRNSRKSSQEWSRTLVDPIVEVTKEEEKHRPLSSERLEARRKEIELLKRKVSGDKPSTSLTKGGGYRKHSLPYDNLGKISLPDSSHQSRNLLPTNNNRNQSHKGDSSVVDPSALRKEIGERDSETRERIGTFERKGLLRDKVRERKKKLIATRSNDETRTNKFTSSGGDDHSSPRGGRRLIGHYRSSSDSDGSDKVIGVRSQSISPSKSPPSTSSNSLSESGSELEPANLRNDNRVKNISMSRHQRADSLKHLNSRFVGRKQKSLRQKVLRKLGQKASLSNSSPDINTAVANAGSDLPDVSQQREEDNPEVKLKRHEAFRQRRPSSPAVLVRCKSEGCLLTDSSSSSSEDDTPDGKMRTLKLTEETFMETYGVIPRRKKKGKDMNPFKRHTTYDINKNGIPGFTLTGAEADADPVKIFPRRRLSASESSSSGSSYYEASLTTEPTDIGRKHSLGVSKSDGDKDIVKRRPRSTGSDDGGNMLSVKNKESRNSWIASLTPHFARKAHKDGSTKESSKTSKKNVFHTPASSLTSASHRGYLDRRNKKKQWERFWCVLQDSCLYLYNSPQSASTQDAIVLRGYDVIANVTNLNRTRFPFRLVRTGSPTLHLSTDNHREYILWVGTLEKETSMVQTAFSDNELLTSSISNNLKSASTGNTSVYEESLSKQKSTESLPKHEQFEQQKEHLLREVLAETQKIIEEQKLLQEQNVNIQLPTSPVSSPTTRISKDQLNEKFSRVREEEEMRTMKHLTLLNKRRNSAQLKVDQFTKQLAPKSGRKRRENPQQFAEMEARLKEMQERLAEVDKEIAERQAMRVDAMGKIQQRLDLELMMLEQRDTLDIIQKHSARQKQSQQNVSPEGNEKLPSIEEMSAISDCSSTSNCSFPDSLSLPVEPRSQNAPTTQQSKRLDIRKRSIQEDTLSNGSSTNDERASSNLSSLSASTDDLIKPRRSYDESRANNLEQTSHKTEIDPSILADIEDFQRFSRQKLASLANQRS